MAAPIEIADLLTESRFLYMPNKLHGDVISSDDGIEFTEVAPGEWLSKESARLLFNRPDNPPTMVFVDYFAPHRPDVFVFKTSRDPQEVWRSLGKLYISDDGRLDPAIGFALAAYEWQSDDGHTLLAVSTEC